MKRVLVMDDDRTCRRLIEEFIRVAGFDVVSCKDGAEGWEKFCSEDFGVIITDYEMPHLNGLEILERVRRAKPEIPVIIFTGAKDTQLRKKAWDMGVFDFLSKPINRDYLTHVLKAAYTFGLPNHIKFGSRKKFQPNPELAEAPAEENLFFNLVDAIGYDAVFETTSEFKKQTQTDLHRLQMAVEDLESQENIAKIAYRLKGAATSLGLDQLASLCDELENLSRDYKKDILAFEKNIRTQLSADLKSMHKKLKQVKDAA